MKKDKSSVGSLRFTLQVSNQSFMFNSGSAIPVRQRGRQFAIILPPSRAETMFIIHESRNGTGAVIDVEPLSSFKALYRYGHEDCNHLFVGERNEQSNSNTSGCDPSAATNEM